MNIQETLNQGDLVRIALHTCNRTETQRLAQLLEAAGAHCSCFATAQAAMQTVHHGGFDVAVIDARAPGSG